MATTVQATTAQRSGQPTPAGAPWYGDRQRLTLIGLGALALVALAVWFVITSSRRKEDFASRALAQAVATADRGNLAQASAELQKVIQTYQGTDAATQAVLTLNQVRLVNGQSELAAGNLREFVASNPPPRYAAPAFALLGAANENVKKFADAAAAYQQAAEHAQLDYLKAEYLVSAARAYRGAGKTENAIRAYRTVLEKYPTAPAFAEAQIRLAEVTAGAM